MRRWQLHAIADGTPLARAVQLEMHGGIRIGRWAPFTAIQRLSVDERFVWAATGRPFGVPVIGFHRWTRSSGEMRWRLCGAVPRISATKEDVTRSAAGRHAGELLVSLPTAALSPEVSLRPLDFRRAVATVRAGGGSHEVTLTVDADGRLTELAMQRWGPAGRGTFALQPFGAALSGEATSGGVTVPQRITAGWHHGTHGWDAGQFIGWTVDAARHC